MACGNHDALALGILGDAHHPLALCLLPLEIPDIVQVFAGGKLSGVLTANGRGVLTLGRNDEGALGNLHIVGEVQFPPEAHGRIIQVDAGANYTLFLTIDNMVYFCGTMTDVGSGNVALTVPGQLLQKGTFQAIPID